MQRRAASKTPATTSCNSRSNVQPFTIYTDPDLRRAKPERHEAEPGVLQPRNPKVLASRDTPLAGPAEPSKLCEPALKPKPARLPLSRSLDLSKLGGPSVLAPPRSPSSAGVQQRLRKPKRSVKQAQAELTPQSNECFTRLLVVRRKILQDLNDENCAPWDVVTNEQLSAIAKARPVTLEELFALPGMEEARVRQFAHEILEAVLDFRHARDALPAAAPSPEPPASSSTPTPLPQDDPITPVRERRASAPDAAAASPPPEGGGAGSPPATPPAASPGEAALQLELRALRRLFLDERARRQSAERRASDLEREADALAARLARQATDEDGERLRGQVTALEDRVRDSTCVACLERPRKVILMPCMHLCLCSECFGRTRDGRCPLCRAAVAGQVVSRL